MRAESSPEDSVIETVSAYLRGEVAFDEATAWLYPLYWDAVEATADGPLLGQVVNLAWQYQDGTISEERLKALLELAIRVPA